MKDTTIISCPKCGAEFPLSEAVSHGIREELQAEYDQRLAETNAALQKREAQLEAEKAAVEQRSRGVADQVRQQLEAERLKLTHAAKAAAEEKLSAEMKDLQGRIGEQGAKLKAAQDAELALRRQKRQLEDAKATFELEMTRKLDAERQKIADGARTAAADAERLKLADKDNVIRGLQEQISALQQRAEQGSMQLQGETLELELEKELRAAFPGDDITEVKKGQRGADVTQRVRLGNGFDCGIILWEAKRAKNWSADWPEKLKDDQRAASADLAVIVTTCPPDGLRGIGQRDGIWVCEPPFAAALANALRQGLVSTAAQRVQQSGRADKAQVLYDHVCSVEFRQHVQAVVEAFTGLQDQLTAEQRAFARQWREREQQLQKAITHTAMLYGGVQGIAGREALPELQPLALPGSG